VRKVYSWHKADILNALTNVGFWGKADIDQPLLTNLDYEYTAYLEPAWGVEISKRRAIAERIQR